MVIALEEMAEMLESITDGGVAAAAAVENRDRLLVDLGLSSFALLTFIVALEERLAFEWSPDTPPEVFSTLVSMHEFITCEFAR